MRKRSDRAETDALRDRLIGLGERSFRKSYYPELQERLDELERFRALLDHTNDLILLARLPEGRIVDANATAFRHLNRESLMGVQVEEILDLGGFSSPREGCRILNATMRRGDGTIFPAEVTLCIDRFETASYLLVVARDISERLRSEAGLKQALAAAQEGKDKVDAIVRSVGDGLLVADTEGRLLLLNRAAEELLDLAADEAVGRPVEEVLGAWLDEERVAVLEEGLHELVLKPQDGRTRFLQARTSPIRQCSDRRTGSVISLQDRTREREIDRMKTEFISTVAHEFRTPLTSIQGFSELLLARELGPLEEREFLDYIHEKAVALGHLVSDLLDIVRIEAGQELPLHPAPWSVRDLLAQVVPLLRSDEQKHRFDISAAAPETRLMVDREKFCQVLENLLSNAMKYSAEGTLVRVCGEHMDRFYRFSVIDEGIGMTPEEVSRVFDKFFRADASNKAIGGIGLGMSIVKGIVEAHRGRIDVKSRPGRGTTVTITLPLALHEGALEGPCARG